MNIVPSASSKFNFPLFQSSGPSMEPTIIENNILYCDHIISRFTGIKSGDIVISRSVTDPNIYICKRVGGVSGDLVWNGMQFITVSYSPSTCIFHGSGVSRHFLIQQNIT